MFIGCSTKSANEHREATNEPSPAQVVGQFGSVVISAQISKGSRFNVYCNDSWSTPQQLPVAVGEWHDYSFKIPEELTSFRIDPTEVAGAQVEIRSIRFDRLGKPTRWMPLTDLMKWLKSDTALRIDDSSKLVELTTTGKNMYLMCTVNLDYYLLKPPE